MSAATKQYEMSQAELKEIYEFACELAARAGDILLDGVDKRAGAVEGRAQGQVDKMNAVDIVTETDLAVEAFVKDEITRKYPDHE